MDNIRINFDEKVIDKIFSPINRGDRPGAAVGIAVEGVPVYRKGFGLASMDLPVQLSPAMRMRIGSTTKQFTAFAYMLLCEEGSAGIDDEVGQYFPEIHEVSRRATMRQLIAHTSGVPMAQAIGTLIHGLGRPETDEEMLAYYKLVGELDFEPGTAFAYNNGGYVLLTAAIERITGQALEQVLRERIFDPIGMHDTLLRRWDTDFVPNSATLHMANSQGRYTRDYMGMEISGAGGIVSTMDDMLRWLKHMDSPRVGSAETWRMMFEPQTLTNGASTAYGLGLMLTPYRGVDTVQHAGSVFAGNAQMIKIPAAKLDISIAVNCSDLSAFELANQIIDACVDGLEDVSEADFEKRVALYTCESEGRVVELSVRDGVQLMAVDTMPPTPVRPDVYGALRLPGPFSIALLPGEKTARLYFAGSETLLDVAEPNPDATLRQFAGKYKSETIEALAELVEREDEVRLVTQDRHGVGEYKLEPLTSTVWRATMLPTGMLRCLVTFDFASGHFTLTAGPSKLIRFMRIGGAL